MSLLQELRRLLELVWARLTSLLSTAPPGSLQLTGVLGLATLLAGFYHARGRGDGGGSSSSSSGHGASSSAAAARSGVGGAGGASSSGGGNDQRRQQQQQGAWPPSSAAAAARAGSGAAAAAHKRGSGAAAQPRASDTPLTAALRAGLAGARRVTISVPGVLLEQADAAELAETAEPMAGAVAVARGIAALPGVELFLLAHVPDDVGAALVAGALEAAGLVGAGAPVPAQRLLLCGTRDGKVSVVRQLEPDLHIDASARTVSDLSRFVPALLLVGKPGASAAPARPSCAGGGSNVETAASLVRFFAPAGSAAEAALLATTSTAAPSAKAPPPPSSSAGMAGGGAAAGMGAVAAAAAVAATTAAVVS